MTTREIRSTTIADIPGMLALYAEHMVAPLSAAKLENLMHDYPAVVAVDGATIIGFAYCGRFAPDILELMNIYVGKQARNTGLGRELLQAIEAEAFKKYQALILVNSGLYETKEKKKFADRFYIQNNFRLLMNTADSFVYGKVKSE